MVKPIRYQELNGYKFWNETDQKIASAASMGDMAQPDEPAWVTRFSTGNSDISPFVAKEIAGQVRELLVYKRAMESMASQFVHPKITAREMAEMQLHGAT